MKTAFAVIAVLTISCVWAQSGAPEMPGQEALTKLLTFEDEHPGAQPKGWGGTGGDSVSVDNTVVHSGKWSVRIERTPDSPQQFTTVTAAVPVAVTGSRIQLRGWMRTQDVSGFAALWMRQDGDTPGLAFDSLQNRDGGVKGTTEWTEYTLSLPLHAEAQRLYFGFLVSGAGKAWADDLQLLVDGKPVWEAPKRPVVETVISKDHEFDSGSKIALESLTPAQVQNLALLGRVWGFLKYHHPRITGGELHWDYELFRVAPAVLAAPDSVSAQKVLLEWVKRTGTAEPCADCAKLDERNLKLKPASEWLRDTKLLGHELSSALIDIHRNRPASGRHFYVKLTPGIGNPIFQNEPAYANVKLPDAGYQLLGLFRYWNIIEYWFPYRDIIDEDWSGVLREFVPRIALAKTRDDYQLQFLALIARVHDTHANLWSSMQVQPPVGACNVPVRIRFVEGRAVVTNVEPGVTALQRGDIVEAVDGAPVPDLVKRWTPFYAASNEPTRLRDMARSLLRGACEDATLKVRRTSEALDVKVARVPPAPTRGPQTHDLPGDTFRKLSPEIAYLKLSSVKSADAAKYVKQAEGSKGLIIDIRNYPSEFMVFSLGQLLVDEPTPFVQFTTGDLRNPGAFHVGMPIVLQPQTPKYEGKVVIIVDEVSQSSAEYTSMAFRASKRAKVIGSTTAGADGNVSNIVLPGGLRTMISGIGVFYPDGRPTQRVGIVPDVEARPTIEGIRAGRDEVLETAVRLIVGDSMPAADIDKITRP